MKKVEYQIIMTIGMGNSKETKKTFENVEDVSACIEPFAKACDVVGVTIHDISVKITKWEEY